MIVSAFVSMVVLNFLAEASSLLKIGTDVQALEIDVNKKPRHRYQRNVGYIGKPCSSNTARIATDDGVLP